MKENVIKLKDKFDIISKKKKLDQSTVVDYVKIEEQDKQIKELLIEANKVKIFEDGIKILKANNKELLKERNYFEELYSKQEEKVVISNNFILLDEGFNCTSF